MTTQRDDLIREHVRHLRRREARAATIAHRRTVLLRFAEDVDMPLRDVTPDDLDRWRDVVAARVSVASLKTYVCQVRAFYQWATRAGHVPADPSTELLVPRVARGRPRPIDEDDLAMALQCARGDVLVWLVLAAFCGLRAGEIAGLGHDALQRTGHGYTITVDGKGGKERTVPCPAEVAALLRPLLRTKGGAVFRTSTGRPVDSRHLSGATSKFLASIGIHATLHQLRHRYGSAMYETSGQDLRLVQELLGHADPTTTTIYVRASAARGRAAADELAKSLKRGNPRRPRSQADLAEPGPSRLDETA